MTYILFFMCTNGFMNTEAFDDVVACAEAQHDVIERFAIDGFTAGLNCQTWCKPRGKK